MMVSEMISAIGDVKAQLNYLDLVGIPRGHVKKPLHPGLYQDFEKDQSNFGFKLGPEEVIHDARNNPDVNFTLDDHGFQWNESPTKMSRGDFDYPDKVRSIYLKEVEAYLKSAVKGADHVRIFSTRVCGKPQDEDSNGSQTNMACQMRGAKSNPVPPAMNMHIGRVMALVSKWGLNSNQE
jgi:hypothetical protein